MSLKLSKTNTPAYNYLSEDGALTNPAVAAVTIDKAGGTKTSASVTLYLVADNEGLPGVGSYSEITIEPTTPTTGITWEVSLDGTTWVAIAGPGDMDCESADVVTPVYARIVCDNSETTPLITGNYAGEFAIAATENPPAI